MKKADEYAALILQRELKLEAAGDVAWQLTMEVKELAAVRKVSTDAGMRSILAEIEDKWRAVVRRVNRGGGGYLGLSPEGFRRLLIAKIPMAGALLVPLPRGAGLCPDYSKERL